MQAQAGEKTIGFLGLDDFNRGILRRSRFDRELTFRELLSIDEMVEVEKGFSFHDLVETAEIRLAERGPVDAIVNHWDFPGSCLHPLVCERNDGRVVVYGVIDSIREHGSSFARYEYPSRLPNHVIERACRAAETLMPAFELGRCCFNVEFFWDDGADRLSLLEVNTRLSKSHCPLFLLADGNSHHAIAIELALGREPGRWPAGAGPHDLAAKSMVRLFQDGVVTGLPREREVARLRERFPDAMLNVLVDEGARLSNLKFQDSYSFELANLFMGGETEQALREQYAEALEILPFEFDLIAPEPH